MLVTVTLARTARGLLRAAATVLTLEAPCAYG